MGWNLDRPKKIRSYPWSVPGTLEGSGRPARLSEISGIKLLSAELTLFPPKKLVPGHDLVVPVPFVLLPVVRSYQ